MFLFFVAACAPEQRPVEIQFDVRMKGEPISCNSGVDAMRKTDLLDLLRTLTDASVTTNAAFSDPFRDLAE